VTGISTMPTAGIDAHSWRGLRRAACVAVLSMLAGCGGTAVEPAPIQVPATDPVALDTPPPTYPLELACANRGGQVVLMLTIGVDGTPGEIRTEVSSRRKALDAAAVAAVRTWRFKPATTRGKPVPASIRVPVTFTPPVMRPDLCFGFDEQQRRTR